MSRGRTMVALGLVLVTVVGPGARPAPGGAVASPSRPLASAHGVGKGTIRIASLVVTHLSPPPGAVEVPRGGLLAVEFARPMVPLAAIGTVTRQAPVIITPPVTGHGRWLGTALWALSGAAGLAGATSYTVRIPAGLRALDGSVLPAGLSWSFQTVRPGIASTVPVDGSRDVAPHIAPSLTFNQPVERAAAQAAVTVEASGSGPTPGAWTWSGQTMTFHASHPWPAGTRVTVRIAAQVRAAGGGDLAMLHPVALHFTIAAALRVTGSTPAPGATDAELVNGVTISLAAPVNPRTVQAAVHVHPAVEAPWVTVAGDGLSISLGGAFLPATRYTVTVDTSLGGLFGGHLRAPYIVSFVTKPAVPSVSFYNVGPVATFDVYRKPTLYARVINVNRLVYALYRTSEAQFRHMASSSFDWSTASANGMTVLRRWAVDVHGTPNRAVNIGQQLLGARHAPLPSGFYYVTASDGAGASDHQLFLITATGLTLKVAQRQIVLWATDLKSGLPVARLAARVVDDIGRVIAAGQTDAQGLLIRDGLHAPGFGSLLDASLLALGGRTGNVSAVSLAWNSGITPWDYNLPFATRQAANRLYIYTERPIYRPGQPLFFRGVARADADGRYTLLPAGTYVRVTLTDALGHTAFSRYYHLSTAGTFSGAAPLGPAAPLGSYTLSALVGADSGATSFSVAEYRKPSFALTVAPDRGDGASYVQGERIALHARATYYFGAPLGHAPVAWSVLADDYLFQPSGFSDYAFTDFDVWSTPYQPSMGSLVTQATGTTDAAGTVGYALRADLMGHRLSQQLTIEAQVGDAAHETVAQRTQVIVHAGAYYLGLRPADVVGRAGQVTAVDLLALRPDGTTRVARASVTLRAYRREWYSVYLRDPATGSFQWQTRPHDTLVTRVTVTTDGQGQATLHFVPRAGGEYRVAADAVDGHGNAIHSATYVWVGSPDYTSWGFANNDRLRLVADRAVYHSGDTARVLVPAPLNDMLALITVERGRVISHRLQRLHGNSTLLSLPISGSDVPDIYVGVVLVKGTGADTRLPVWKMGYLHLAVDQMERALRVTVTPDRAQATPGDRVRYTVHTADFRGRPVAAEVSLALVDAAVLALAQDENTSLLDTFYADRELGVETAQTLALFIDRINLNEGLGAKGGSGGGGGGGGHPPTRQRFPDTAYWNPHVVTDAAGNAVVTVTLPDSLTTWRMVARGVTPDGLVGGGSGDIVATKSLLITPALPRFLTLGDRARLGAVIANNGAAALRVRATLATAGAVRAFPMARTETVPGGGQVLVTWPATASTLGNAGVEFAVSALDGSGRSDRVVTGFPVRENSTPETVAAAGSVAASQGNTNEVVSLPSAREPGEGELTIGLQPSITAGLGSAAAMLDSYPYECVEQTTSRAVGEGLVGQVPLATSGLASGLAVRLPDLLTTSMQRLLSLQHGDGGWGWWADDTSSLYMSAYAVDGLLILRHLGTAVDADALGRGLDYLHQGLTNPPTDPLNAPNADLLAYVDEVLARGGRGDLGLTVGLLDAERPAAYGPLTAAGRAYLALALFHLVGPRDARVSTLLAQIEAAAHLDATGAHWDAAQGDWRTLASTIGTTAIVLDALATLDPTSELVPDAARWLLAARDGEAWTTTQQTALAVRALVHVSQSTGELVASYRYTVIVAGRQWASGIVAPATPGQSRTLVVPLSSLPTAGGVVRFVVHGLGVGKPARGRLYYTLRLRYLRPVEHLAPLAQGVAVTRTYTPVRGIAALGGGTPPWAAGSTVRVTLSVVAPQDLYYVLLEDPLPAGAEGVDSSLLTTSAVANASGGQTVPRGTDDLTWFVTHNEVRDDRVALFADYLPAGAYQYTYLIHLTTPGTFHALPTRVVEMYVPDVFGRASGLRVAIHGQ